MPAARRLNGNAAEAVGTFLGGWLRGRRFFLVAVDALDQQEDSEGYDQEADDLIEENADVNCRGTRFLRLGQGLIVTARERDEDVGKIDTAQQQADRRHNHVGHQRFHYRAEGQRPSRGSTDNEA